MSKTKKTNKKIKRRKQTSKNTTILPKLNPMVNTEKKYKYKLSDNTFKRKRALNDGVKSEAKRMNKTMKQAAISKKGRLNILRIYRRNNNNKQCNIITKDMKYLDKKYKLGKTKNICS